MKVAVLGAGGREHALIWKLRQTLEESDLFWLPGNPCYGNSAVLDILNFKTLKAFCEKHGITLLVVGPELPLVHGIADFFKGTNIQVFGPSKAAAQLEASKLWAKRFMDRHRVATGGYWSFNQVAEARSFVEAIDGECVIKYDGLAAGKGVTVTSNVPEALAALDALEAQYGDTVSFLIEEKLVGEEVSIIGFTDGRVFRALLPSQDHKRALDGDQGPNTGGMGAFCPATFCDEKLLKQIDEAIIQPTMRGIFEEALDYKGALYFGVMVTERGPKLLEYNVRLGDPEAEILLPAMDTDLLEVIQACMEERLSGCPIACSSRAFVDVVLTSGGYPGDYETGKVIQGLDRLAPDTLVFHAGTREVGGQTATAGGRVLNIVCQGETLEAAVSKVYQECEKIHFDGMAYRKDIAAKGILKERLVES